MTAPDPINSLTTVLAPVDIPGRTGPVSVSPTLWGLNIAAVLENFPQQGLHVRIDAWEAMGGGDLLKVFWDKGHQVLQKTIEQDEVDKVLQLFIESAQISEGQFSVSYTVKRVGQIEESSEELLVLVKLTRPAGHDDNNDPGHSRLTMRIPQDILDDGIHEGNIATGVHITIEPYPNIAARDVIRLSWGGIFVFSTPLTQDQTEGKVPIIVFVSEANIREAGDSVSAGLVVVFDVYDLVQNRSQDWSTSQRVVVAINSSRLDAPTIVEALDNVLDLEALGEEPGTAQILVKDDGSFELDDIPVIRIKGSTVEGGAIDFEVTGESLISVPSSVRIPVPNALLRQFAKSRFALSFRLKKADDSEDLYSKSQFIDAIGEIRRLAAPVALDAEQGALDPELKKARVEIPFDNSFRAGQVIQPIWLGTRFDQTPYMPPIPSYPITQGEVDAKESIKIAVDGMHLIPIKDGTLELYYQLNTAGVVLNTPDPFSANHSIRESIHAEILRVGQPNLELPEPEVAGVFNGALPPDTSDTTLTVKYLSTAAGDEVIYEWIGWKTGTATDSVILNSHSAGKPVTFPIGSELIKGNDGGQVLARYSIKRATGGHAYSHTLTFVVGPAVSPLRIAGHRTQTGPHYHSNPSRLIASAPVGDEICWTYQGETQTVCSASFLDEKPEKSLLITATNGGVEVARKVLRPGNVTGVFNLGGRHSGCVVTDDGGVFGWSENSEMLPPSGLTDVRCVTAGGRAFAALKKNATVSAWGAPTHGGVIAPDIQIQLTHVTKLAATSGAFLALREDGRLIAWGHPDFAGVIPASLAAQLTAVEKIIGNTADFSAVLRDGRVASWGATYPEGQWIPQANGATRIGASDRAFCVLKSDRSAFSWGSPAHGGVPPSALTQIVFIAATSAAFAALKEDGSVTAWGNQRFGGESPHDLSSVEHLCGSTTAFCALKTDGSIVAWGEPAEGATVPQGLSPVDSISASYGSFAAVLSDGRAVSWGINASLPPITAVVCAYAAGPHVVLLGENGTVQAVGVNAPDLTSLIGKLSYIE